MSTKLAEIGNNIDSRYTAAAGIRRQINKVFPTHWSFMLGEIALYSFLILLLTSHSSSTRLSPRSSTMVRIFR